MWCNFSFPFGCFQNFLFILGFQQFDSVPECSFHCIYPALGKVMEIGQGFERQVGFGYGDGGREGIQGRRK